MKLPFFLLVLAFAGALSAQQISVTMGSQVISDGQASVDLGDVPTGLPQSVQFTIHNDGAAALVLNGLPALVDVTAGSNVAASVVAQPSASIAAGQSTTFTLNYTATTGGPFSMQVSIDSNAALGAFDFTLTGTAGTVAEINVSRNGTLIVNGSVDAVGSLDAGQSALLTYTVQNTGLVDLNLNSQATVTSEVNCSVTIMQQPAQVLGPGESSQLVLNVTANSDAPFTFNVNIANDTETPGYSFDGTGTVLLAHSDPPRHRVEINCTTGENSAEFLLFAAIFAGIAIFIQRRTMA